MISKYYLEELGHLEVHYPFTLMPFFATICGIFQTFNNYQGVKSVELS